ncbi:DUF5655 domain-containing protein [Exiguobacterium sp.]|uniref:DUF5655 domain-containing protein n=1 Tax=Exiguobacterium sp. TaxID=44751 RepID=UPI0028A2212F|nr:DUF5655 domain-containing protein [Exiguobacterium sp.]
MGDIKFFKINNGTVQELNGQSIRLEKSLQKLIENHLESFLGIRFLASEYSTGKRHGGRIDTLGIDENNSPVIIEYKRSTNENVINQGLFYLDWLLDHKAEFKLLVMQKYPKIDLESIEWSSPRLLCIAGSFNRYDEHAVQQINRNIELYQYKHYDEGFLMLDLVNATTEQLNSTKDDLLVNSLKPINTRQGKTVSEYIERADDKLIDRYENLKAFILALGDDIQVKVLKYYIAFKRIKNFVCVEVHPQSNIILLYLKINPSNINIEPGFTRDVSNIGHYGTGDFEIRISNDEELEKAKTYIEQSYDLS